MSIALNAQSSGQVELGPNAQAAGSKALGKQNKAGPSGFQAIFQKIFQNAAKTKDPHAALGLNQAVDKGQKPEKTQPAAKKQETRLTASKETNAKNLDPKTDLSRARVKTAEAKAPVEQAPTAESSHGLNLKAKKDALPAEEASLTKAKADPKRKGENKSSDRELSVRYDLGAEGAHSHHSLKKTSSQEGSSIDKADSGAKTKGKSQKAKLDVYDLRKADGQSEAAEAKKAQPSADKPNASGASHEANMQIDVSTHGQGAEAKASSSAKGADGSFAARLAERLQDTYNGQIVQHSAIVLRDGGAGLIRLNLKPESLGNVKVHLDLADNSITGTIVVESEAAKDAFSANLEHLAKSFVDSGFDSATLNVTVDNGSANQGGGQSAFGNSFGGNGATGGRETPRALASSSAYSAQGPSSAIDIMI
jgi:flagellar hook-length control protein FliK